MMAKNISAEFGTKFKRSWQETTPNSTELSLLNILPFSTSTAISLPPWIA